MKLSLALLAIPALASQITLTSGQFTNGSIFVGPLQATIDSAPATVYCIDYDHAAYLGQSWAISTSPIAPGSPEAQAAWIAEHITPANVVDTQYAIWALFSSAAPHTPGADLWLSASMGQSPVGAWLTLDAVDGQHQRFMTETPELGGLAYGLCGLAFLWYLRRVQRQWQ